MLEACKPYMYGSDSIRCGACSVLAPLRSPTPHHTNTPRPHNTEGKWSKLFNADACPLDSCPVSGGERNDVIYGPPGPPPIVPLL